MALPYLGVLLLATDRPLTPEEYGQEFGTGCVVCSSWIALGVTGVVLFVRWRWRASQTTTRRSVSRFQEGDEKKARGPRESHVPLRVQLACGAATAVVLVGCAVVLVGCGVLFGLNPPGGAKPPTGKGPEKPSPAANTPPPVQPPLDATPGPPAGGPFGVHIGMTDAELVARLGPPSEEKSGPDKKQMKWLMGDQALFVTLINGKVTGIGTSHR